MHKEVQDGDAREVRRALIAAARDADIRFSVTPEEEARIQALASDIEPLNPNPDGSFDKIAGRWRLLYSSFRLERQATLRRLSFAKLPDIEVTVTGIYQEIAADGSQYNNLVEFHLGDLQGVQETHGSFTTAPPHRLNISFSRASVYAADAAMQESDFRARLGVDSGARLSADVSFDGWSDITYVDDSLRLMRGNLGNLYVIVRDDGPIRSF